MGLAQGASLAGTIRAEVARRGLPLSRRRFPSLRAIVSGPLRGQGAGRELFRHFAHQAERLEGLAQAAGLPLDSALALQLALHDPFAVGAVGAVGAAGAAGAPGAPGAAEAVAAAAVSARAPSPADWMVRESRPVVGFRSLEVTLPWLVPAFAGINAAGLAVAVEAVAQTVSTRTPSVSAAGGHSGDAPAILLVQDCLARFEHVAGAVDWCRKRPAAGELAFAFADATGMRARVVVSGRERRVEARLEDERDAATREAGVRLECVLGGAGSRRQEAVVRLEPENRRLRVDWMAEGELSEAFEYSLEPHREGDPA